MPPKRRLRGGSNSADLFQYNNTVELTFKTKRQEEILAKAKEIGDSSDEEDNLPILKKKGKKNIDTSSSDSSSASDSDNEVKDPIGDLQDTVYEISDEKDDVGPRAITPPPNIPHNAPPGMSRQAVKLSRAVGEKMRYLQYLQNAVPQDTPSPVSRNLSDVVVVEDSLDYGTPTPSNRQIKIRIRSRFGVERFSLTRDDKFEEIFTEIAVKHNVKVNLLSFSFTDAQGNFQMLKGTDTPNSVNLSLADIIECVVVQSARLNEPFENSDNLVNIKFQGSDTNSVKRFKACKNESLGKIMQHYADFRHLPLSKLQFLFDGEPMMSEQTPDELDMDDDNVVDVKIK